MDQITKQDAELILLANSILKNKASIESIKNKFDSAYELYDGFYRFYHHSFKVFRMQTLTEKAVTLFKEIHESLNPWYLEIISEGTNQKFSIEDNKVWLKKTRPIVEAALHTKIFVDSLHSCLLILSENKSFGQIISPHEANTLYLFNNR